VKGRDYQRAAQHFDLDGKGLSWAFSELLVEATLLLGKLEGFELAKAD